MFQRQSIDLLLIFVGCLGWFWSTKSPNYSNL